MEQSHPVPQNISSFEFHLIGDMTLKQFVYLAAGVATAYLIFIFFAKSTPFVAWPLIVISALVGTSYAFLPIAERPLDHWTAAFFKAIFKPTQRRFSSKVLSQDDPNFKKRLDIYLQNQNQPVPAPTATALPPKIDVPVSTIQTPAPQTAPAPSLKPVTQPVSAQPTPAPQQPQPVTPPPSPPPKLAAEPNLPPKVPFLAQIPQMFNLPENPEEKGSDRLPTPNELKKAVDLAKQAQQIQSKIVEDEEKLEEIKRQAASPDTNPGQFTKQFDSVLSDLQQLNKEASDISHQLAQLSKTPSAPTTQIKAPLKVIPTLSLTSIPNIINGIVTDTQGNYLDGVIVVAHDKQGLPVRALKSNKLGQFITATPLPDGIYSLTAEKESLLFPSVEIELKGEVLQPLVISAQKGGVS